MIDLAAQGSFSYVVLGDAILDEYVYGRAERVSPEAPVPVVSFERREFRLGGAANVANHFAKLGSRSCLVSCIGGDVAGDELSKLAILADIELGPARSSKTPHKIRVVANDQQIVRIDEECAYAPSEDALYGQLESLLNLQVSAVVVSDYAKGSVTSKTMLAAVALSSRRKCPLIVDPKQHDWSIYQGASVLTPNIDEIKDSPSTVVAELGLEALVLTEGAKGVSVYLASGEIVMIPSEAREVYDVTGAGDTVTAMLAVAHANGCDWVEAARFANMAAGLVVGRAGTSVPSPADLLEASNPSKIVAQDGLLSRVATWKRDGRKVVFTNGCFDLLHVGHMRLLTEARAQGDVLVVGLDSDVNVRKLKGPDRPRSTANRRAEVLAALEATTAICVFDDLEQLIREVEPDVLVKGADYEPEQVVGRAYAKRLMLVQLVPGASSSEMLRV